MAAKRLVASPAFRFSIRQLLVWTAFVALACVALRNASSAWVAALLGASLLILTAAVPLAIFRSQGHRAFWIGFALFGWLYMLTLAYGWSLDPNASHDNPLRPGALVTARLTGSGYERLYGEEDMPQQSYVAQQIVTFTMDGSGTAIPNYAPSPYSAPLSLIIGGQKSLPAEPLRIHFVNIAHAFWAILLAALGGWFTRWVYATRPVQHDTAQHDTVQGEDA